MAGEGLVNVQRAVAVCVTFLPPESQIGEVARVTEADLATTWEGGLEGYGGTMRNQGG